MVKQYSTLTSGTNETFTFNGICYDVLKKYSEIAKRNNKFINIKCVNCGVELSRRLDVMKKCSHCRCVKCTKKGIALRGELNPGWKERKKCIDCGITLPARGNRPYKRCKQCFNIFNSKGNHWNWQNGISSENHIIRGSIEYKTWALAVKNRDNYTCQICNKRNGEELHSDHIKPFSLYPDLRFEISNGRTLCVDCHYKYGWSLFKHRNPRKENAKATHFKSVYCLNTNKVYSSYKEACAKLGVSRSLIYKTTSGKMKSSNGYTFRDLNEELLIF